MMATVIVLVVVVVLLARFAFNWTRGIEVHAREPEREFAPGRKFRVIRNVTKKECSWLNRRGISAGTILFEYLGPTYGLKHYDQLIFVSRDGGIPFFAFPRDAIVEIGHRADETI